MVSDIFDSWAHIQEDDIASLKTRTYLIGCNLGECMPLLAIGIKGAIHARKLPLGDSAQLDPQPGHGRVGKVVTYRGAPALTPDKTSALQALKMLRGIRNTQSTRLSQLLNCAWRLHEQIQQFKPMRIGNGLGHLGDQFVECFFRLTCWGHNGFFQCSIELLNY